MFKDLDKSAAYDADRIEVNQSVVIKFVRPEGYSPDDCQELVNLFPDIIYYLTIFLCQELILSIGKA